MSDLDETWLAKSFYDQPLSIWNFSSCINPYNDWNTYPVMDIFTAASIGDYNCVKNIIVSEITLTKAVNDVHWNALMYAVYYNHQDIVLLLLKSGSHLHDCNASGQNILMIAAKMGYETLVDQFLNFGSVIESRDIKDWTALIYAAYFDNLEVVKVLLDHRANPNACVRSTGETPLILAVRNDNQVMVEWLLNAGAYVRFKSMSGKDAYDYAVEEGHHHIAALLSQWTSKASHRLLEGSSAIESRYANPYQQSGYFPQDMEPNLDSLLSQLGLGAYIPVFRQHEVDLLVFLSLSDKDLKECGVTELGPRRKMTEAISRWHNNAPFRRGLESAYALKLQVELQNIQEQHAEYKRTEAFAVDMKKRLMECRKRCIILQEQLLKIFQSTSFYPLQKRSEIYAVSSVYIDDVLRLTDVENTFSANGKR